MLKTIILGTGELTSGFYSLPILESEATRFIFASAFLGFGGMCVLMQTASVTNDLGLGLYLPGKLVQSAISFFLSFGISTLLYKEVRISVIIVSVFILLFLCSVVFLRKNSRFIANNDV